MKTQETVLFHTNPNPNSKSNPSTNLTLTLTITSALTRFNIKCEVVPPRNVMNEPACRAAILHTFLHSRPSPKFNPKTKPNTNPIAADATYTELQASSASPKSSARHFVQN